jgi:hypothetical protein
VPQESPRDAAINELDAFLSDAPLHARPLVSDELRAYRSHAPQYGWQLKVRFPDRERRLDVLACALFPREPIKVALVDRPQFLAWPHVEKDGVLCLLPSSAEVDRLEPVAACAAVLNEACELVAKSSTSENAEDFREEFLTYWGWDVKKWQIPIWSLLKPEGPSRVFYYWSGQTFFLLGETKEDLQRWRKNFFHDSKSQETEFMQGALLWLPQLPTPAEYPRSGSSILEIADSVNASSLLTSLYDEETSHLLIVIGGTAPTGPCFGATIVSPAKSMGKPGTERGNTLIRGFRPGHAPQKLIKARLFGAASISRGNVERADASWVHGRDSDHRFRRLRDSSIAIFGCGSLGSHIAAMLAEAGVGRMLLFDYQLLQWANIGRHALGANSIGSNKAEALANKLKREYPHAIEILGIDATCQKALDDRSSELVGCNLLIAAMGNWAAEGALNAWYLQNKLANQIVYGWTEPHAAAGHAVAVSQNGGCLQCGFDSNGKPKLAVSSWPQSTLQREPGCGAAFQPYGPIELSHATALVADLSLDCLLGSVAASTHRIWCGRRALVLDAGGEWTKEWSDIAGSRTLGAFVEELLWGKSATCSDCVLAAA